MADESEAQRIHAIILVNDPGQAAGIADTLNRRGISTTVRTDPEETLLACRSQTPQLVLVEDNLPGMSGMHFLADLLKISWTTSTILICDEDEDVVHEKTEGLGILGSLRSVHDIDGMNRLLEAFFRIGLGACRVV